MLINYNVFLQLVVTPVSVILLQVHCFKIKKKKSPVNGQYLSAFVSLAANLGLNSPTTVLNSLMKEQAGFFSKITVNQLTPSRIKDDGSVFGFSSPSPSSERI